MTKWTTLIGRELKMQMKPLAIDLCCGLGGWAESLLAEGYDVIGVDIERHEYGEHRYPGLLVIQDVRTLHGSQFKDAALIVASPPCQKYSYMAMPWKRAKAQAAAIRADTSGKMLADLNCLFDACFRIQAQASLAAGRHVPMIVENVRGAQPWVGRSRWAFGSFHLWGDVPALMPMTAKAQKVPGFRFDGSGRSFQSASVAETGTKVPGLDWNGFKNGDPNYRGQAFNTHADRRLREDGLKLAGPKWDPSTKSGAHGMKRWTNPAEGSGLKCGGDWFGDDNPSAMRRHSSKSPARKMASAMIAKIPLPLGRHIAAVYRAAPNHQ